MCRYRHCCGMQDKPVYMLLFENAFRTFEKHSECSASAVVAPRLLWPDMKPESGLQPARWLPLEDPVCQTAHAALCLLASVVLQSTNWLAADRSETLDESSCCSKCLEWVCPACSGHNLWQSISKLELTKLAAVVRALPFGR